MSLSDLQKVMKIHQNLNKTMHDGMEDLFKTVEVKKSEILSPYYEDCRRKAVVCKDQKDKSKSKKSKKSKKGGGKHGSPLVSMLLVGVSNIMVLEDDSDNPHHQELFTGFVDLNGDFNYTINRDPRTLTIANKENFNIDKTTLTIDRDGREREEVDLNPIGHMGVEDDRMIELLEKAIRGENSTPLTGGKSRQWVYKVDAFGYKLVIKSNSSIDEYICMCKAYIKGIPVTPPLGLYKNNILVEAFINQGDHKEDYLKATYQAHMFTDLRNKYDAVVETLKIADMGGDFKLDNLMINSNGEIVMTDYYVNGCRNWSDWEMLAQSEGLNYSFGARLQHYIEVKRNDHEITYVPILRENNGFRETMISRGLIFNT